uniref:polynucleotide adenylyltransferase n=2 Tax=Salmo trutta TaxID=8032 RepID=A0A674A1E9_SALTR
MAFSAWIRATSTFPFWIAYGKDKGKPKIMELQMDRRFHNLTLEQVQTLDQVLTEVIPIHGRGNFPTLEVRPKDIIHVVKDRLVEREIRVRDIRLNGSTASYVMVRDNGTGYRDLDIIFGVELPRQEDFQVIKEVVLGSLRDLLPHGVNRRKITCLTMKEAYVQKMVKVFNEHDRWSLISLSNNRGKTVGLRFVHSLRRQFEFSVDSFQIILDHMLESYWETERRQGGQCEGLELHNGNVLYLDRGAEKTIMEPQYPSTSVNLKEDKDNDSMMTHFTDSLCHSEEVIVQKEESSHLMDVHATGKQEEQEVLEKAELDLGSLEDEEEVEEVVITVDTVKIQFVQNTDYLSVISSKTITEEMEPLVPNTSVDPQSNTEELLISESKDINPSPMLLTENSALQQEQTQLQVILQATSQDCTAVTQNVHLEHSFLPPAKKTCDTSQQVVPDFCPSPKSPRKMSRKMSSTSSLPEKWSLLKDLSDLTTQLFEPIEILPTIQPNPSLIDTDQGHYSSSSGSRQRNSESTKSLTDHLTPAVSSQDKNISPHNIEQIVRVKYSKKPPDSEATQESVSLQTTGDRVPESEPAAAQEPGPPETTTVFPGPSSALKDRVSITVVAECMYGDFQQAMDHLRFRLIATHNPEEIRGGGLLKYSDLLVRNFRPASETEIKSLERYMCSRFFIDFPDLSEQQRKIEAYLRCHFIGDEETSKYDFLMTLRRVIDESTVCLMGHERRQTLNMITVLALRVLGEQNAIPNTANVTCFYQPAPYMADPIFSSYYIPQAAQPPLLYHPYPLHVHMQTGLV